MSFGSQKTEVDTTTTLANLVHDVFVGDVQKNVRRESPAAMLFQDAGPGEYRLEGDTMRFAQMSSF